MNQRMLNPALLLMTSALLFATACGDDADSADESTDVAGTDSSGKADVPEMNETDTDDPDPTSTDGGSGSSGGPENDADVPPCDPAAVGGEPISWLIDETYAHTTETVTLPLLGSSDSPTEGLVRIAAGGHVFRARVYGLDNEGPNIIMLHGFPSSSIMWEHAASAAAEAGYRVVAFDQRGYSPGARPGYTQSYLAQSFAYDVEAVADAVGFERFHLVGHDVGCVVSWVYATLFGAKLDSLACLSVSHPLTLADQIINDPPEYIQLFSLPEIPERVLAANEAAQLRSQYAFMNDAECREYSRLFMEPDALRATVDFYRGIRESFIDAEDIITRPVEVPTLFIYGEGEQWVTPETLAQQSQIVAAPYREEELTDAGPTGHFIVEARRERVTELLLEHFATHAK